MLTPVCTLCRSCRFYCCRCCSR